MPLNGDVFDLGLRVLGSRAGQMEFVFKSPAASGKTRREIMFQCIDRVGAFYTKCCIMNPEHKVLTKCVHIWTISKNNNIYV
jgi:hypothetical protein